MATTVGSDGTPTNGSDPWLDSLVWGGHWTDNDGGTVTITYSLESGAAPLSVFSGSGKTWSTAESDALRAAFDVWESVANIEFVEVSSGADIEYWLGSDSQVGALGWHNLPINNAFMPLYGVFSYEGFGWDSAGLEQGGYGFVTLIHEIGHGLGLAHPHDGGSEFDASQFPGVTASNDTGDYDLNQGIWTTMSYLDGWQTYGTSGSTQWGWQGTAMALDVAAVQLLYGANTSYASGSDTYVLPDSNGAGTFWSAIWDTGGIDTISHAGGNNAATINLNDAPLAADPANAGGFVSYANGIIGGFTIANGVVIENAVGGNAADLITGNEYSNSLWGGAGNDTINGMAGADWLFGDAGDDTLFGGDGRDVFEDLFTDETTSESATGGAGYDTYLFGAYSNFGAFLSGVTITSLGGGTYRVEESGNSSNYVLLDEIELLAIRNSRNEIILEDIAELLALDNGSAGAGSGTSGDDVIAGTILDDSISGGTGRDIIQGFGGDDDIAGGSEDDIVLGGAGSDVISGDDGADILLGGSGSDTLLGGTGNDKLSGGSGDDTLDGGSDDDWLKGGAGNDTLTGDTGADVFVFHDMTQNSTDTITDFENGVDLIEISLDAYAGQSANFGSLNISQVGLDTEVSLGNSTIILLNTTATDIESSDFIF